MMPYIQGDFSSVPEDYEPYKEIIETVFCKKGDLGFLTIDESVAVKGTPHRGDRAKYGRALHTEAGRLPNRIYCWGGGHWGDKANVELERDVRIILANNLDNSTRTPPSMVTSATLPICIPTRMQSSWLPGKWKKLVSLLPTKVCR